VTLAILCSGQGPQHREMFALTGDARQAAGLFAHAATLLNGHDPREMVKVATDEALRLNFTAQILCALQPLAAASALRDAWPSRLVVAGYSVGEVAAWGVVGLIEGLPALDLVAGRARAMDAASPAGDGLLFVRGLSRGAVDTLCRCHAVAVAIVNPGDAYVLGGAGAALDALAEEAKAMGATRVVHVSVAVASHTSRLTAASAGFRKVLDRAPFRSAPVAGIRLFSGIDASPVTDLAGGVEKLVQQITHTIQWADCLAACVEAGASAFLELGPGRALTDMVANVYPSVPARSLDDFRSLEGALAWLARVAR
jgi:[acyl-carrier-protein] S-malonyltransferase